MSQIVTQREFEAHDEHTGFKVDRDEPRDRYIAVEYARVISQELDHLRDQRDCDRGILLVV